MKLVWVLLFIAFAIKVPIVPLHTWLPDAHVEAPTAISVILAGVLLKMGPYGLLRISWPMLPEATRWAADGGGGHRRDQHRLRRPVRHGPEGSEAAGGVFRRSPTWAFACWAWRR